MKMILRFSLLLAALTLFSNSLYAQISFDGIWRCAYATADNAANGTGINTIDVATVGEDEFAALINRGSKGSYYLVSYRDATANSGRIEDIAYSADGLQTEWLNGFDQVFVYDANAMGVGPDGTVYVANNDDARSILTFTIGTAGIESAPYRLPTSADYLWAIDLDDNGLVYVTEYDTTTEYSRVIIYDNVTNEASWGDPQFTPPTALQTIDLPDFGEARGIAVNGDGSTFYVSTYTSGKILKYDGDPVNGYTKDDLFVYENIVEVYDTSIASDTITARPWGLSYMDAQNILVCAHDVNFSGGVGYQYGKMLYINPYTAENVHEVDVAMHDYVACDSNYSNRPSDVDTAASYVSLYNVDTDAQGNIYTQSFYGWVVYKWYFDGTLPVITGIKEDYSVIPDQFELDQNYPNPFNPSTSIKFSLAETEAVTLSIYTITGELIGNLIKGREFNAGSYTVSFDASNLSSGVYIYSLTAW